MTELDTPAMRTTLRRFLSRPISRRLIGEVETAIVRQYRRTGFSLVAVTTPEQEITRGVLQVRAIRFTAGRMTVTHATPKQARYIARQVRWPPGEPVDTRKLSSDIAWVNRFPFRQVSAAFSPGAGFGETDLDLTMSNSRPLRAYAGYASSGSITTGRDRIFVGLQAGGPSWLPDAVGSYQFTAAPRSGGSRYLSHAVQAEVPIADRRAVEVSYDHVATRRLVQVFVSRQTLDEASLGLRISLPSGAYWFPLIGSGHLGVEVRRVRGDVTFGDVGVQHTAADVVQGFAGYTAGLAGPRGNLAIDATLHVGRAGKDVQGQPPGRGGERVYAYVNARLSGDAPLKRGLSLRGELFVQAATSALPQTELISTGGPALVRGYVLEDGAFDGGVVLRTTLIADGWHLPGARAIGGDAFRPLVFVDAGRGFSSASGRPSTAVSAGIGAEYRVGSHLQAGVTQACALHAAAFTPARTCRWEARLTVVR